MLEKYAQLRAMEHTKGYSTIPKPIRGDYDALEHYRVTTMSFWSNQK